MTDNGLNELHLEQLYERLNRIEEKIDKLQEFKVTSLATVRLASMVVSGVCGLLTMIATSVLNYFLSKQS
jgi:uncharacterized membrane protein